MIKVLHIEISDKIGGIETFLKNISYKINKKKFTFDFLSSSSNPPLKDEIEKLGYHVYSVPTIKSFLSHLRSIDRILKNGDYDIVHFHKNSCANIIPLLLCKKNKVKKIIFHSHNTSSNYGLITNFIHYINRPIVNTIITDRFACSKVAANWLFGRKNNAIIINNGVDLNKYQFSTMYREEIRKLLGVKEDEKLLLHIGRFEKQKNHLFLCKIFKEIRKKNKKVKLLMIGRGSLEGQIYEEMKEDINNKDVLHIKETNEIAKFFSAADAFVFPSLYEGLPVVLVEAQASGISTYVSENISREIKLTDNICFLPIVSVECWVNEILNNISDDNRIVEREKMKEYDINYTVALLEQYYKEIVER